MPSDLSSQWSEPADMTVLFVDDDRAILEGIEGVLRERPYQVMSVESAEGALALVTEQRVDVIIADDEMPGMRGVELLAMVRHLQPAIPRLLLTGQARAESVVEAVNQGQVFRIITKPYRASDLAATIRDALELRAVTAATVEIWAGAARQHQALATLRRKARELAGDEAVLDVATVEEAQRAALVMVDAASLERDRRPGARWTDASSLPEDDAVARLSRREREIVVALGSGLGPKDVARELDISPHTVRNHMKAIYRKLRIHSRYELLTWLAARKSPRA